MATIKVKCPYCGSEDVVRHGKTARGIQVYECRNKECNKRTFQMEYIYKGSYPDAEEKIVAMAINGSGIRDTERVLGISHDKIIDVLKKRRTGSGRLTQST
jgi:transposase-like protein